MNLYIFLKNKLFKIISLIFVIMIICAYLGAIQTPKFALIMITILFLSLEIISIIVEYIIKSNYYNDVNNKLEKLDKKYLLPELIDKTNFVEGNILYDVILETNKSMIDNVNEFKRTQEDFKDYINAWVHEIKTPIATSKLIVENNKKNKELNEINEQLDKVESYVEQALYFSKIGNVSNDYIIKPLSLDRFVKQWLKENSNIFITNNVSIELKNLDYVIYADVKWLQFILNQIINNSIKYGSTKIILSAVKNPENICFEIIDNGIGIPKKDLSKVFNKGFTGENGRKNFKSTGIGLYICKRLCEKLEILIKIDSKENIGTNVTLIFPISSFVKLEE